MNRSKEIIQHIIDGISIEELCGTIDTIPLQDIDETIRTIDQELKHQLIYHATLIHDSMRSHHNMGSMSTITTEFVLIEKYLKYLVYDKLSVYERLYLSIIRFFVDTEQDEELNNCIRTIQGKQQEIVTYNTILILKSKRFFTHLEAYQNWTSALTQSVPRLIEKYGPENANLMYSISKLVLHAAEFLTAQRQLESTIKLQIQNNHVVITDILHIVTVSQSLAKNTISAQQFFEQEYVGSVKILKKYTNKG